MKFNQKQIVRELKALSDKFKAEGKSDYHNLARKEINTKYGKGWREDEYRTINKSL